MKQLTTLLFTVLLNFTLFSQEIIQYGPNHSDTLNLKEYQNPHFLNSNSFDSKSTFPYLNSYYNLGPFEGYALDAGFHSIQVDSSYYICGRTRINPNTTINNEIAFAMKLDIEGNKIWQRKDSVADTDHWDNDRGSGLISLTNGELLHVFHNELKLPNDSGYFFRPACIKLNKTGNVLDTFIWPYILDFLPSGLIAENDGGFSLVGRLGSETLVWNQSFGQFVNDTTYLGIIRLDSNMNIIKRAKHFHFYTNSSNYFRDIIKSENNGYIIGGKTAVPSAGNYKYFITKLDSNYNLKWHKLLDDPISDFFNPINLVKSKYNGYYYTKEHPTKGIAYGKFNENGDILWEKYFKKQMDPSDTVWSIYDRPHGLIEKDNGDIIFGTRINFYAYAGLVRADSTGNIIWSRMISSRGQNGEIIPLLLEEVENPIGEGALLVGRAHQHGIAFARTDSLGCTLPNCMDTLWGVGINEVSKLKQKDLMLYPNPAKDILNFALSSEGEIIKCYKVFSINGSLVSQKNINSNNSKINISSFSKGVYLIEITTNKGNIIREKFVKEYKLNKNIYHYPRRLYIICKFANFIIKKFKIRIMIDIKLPDNSVRKVEEGSTALDIAMDISPGLARNVLAAKFDGEVIDAFRPLPGSGDLKLLTWDDKDGKAAMWHSSAHLMAEAIENLYPGTRFGIGPDVENGFYYDIDPGQHNITSEDLPKIEKKMIELAREKQTFERKEVAKADAIDEFSKKGDPYKVELINDLEDGTISFYTCGNFTDLCRGPHIPNTKFIKAIKLTSIAGAYWRGDENNKQLTRIYGITFPKKKMLDEYLELLEEAKKRDHRKIGKELGLFAFSQRVGQGLPLWLPKGAQIRERLENYLKRVQKESGYEPVVSPHIGSKELYVTSGHYAKYGEDSFQPINTPAEGEEFLLKPMNCPHHCEIYKNEPHSYRELPIRYAEFGTVYRYEQSGELHGLTRVRGFTQDDAHIFCRPDQVKSEFKNVIEIVLKIFKALDFKDFETQISIRDTKDKSKYIGSDENWEKAENAIIEVAKEEGLNYFIEEGEAAFYGPKMDFMVKDAIGRKWQLGTIQVDYNLPERFELEYVGEDNQKHRPVMIHRAPFGSMERFFAILIEHTAGKFPLWLTPEQVKILPISEKYHKYSEKVLSLLNNSDIRAQIDYRSEKTGRKIRDAELERVPYMLIIGAKEEEENKISVRRQGDGDMGVFDIQEFISKINTEVEEIFNV